MKTADAPSRAELIAWCRERAEANRGYRGWPLSVHATRLIQQEWPVYFEAIAYLLERDTPKPTGANDA